jgi:hypothetical protein
VNLSGFSDVVPATVGDIPVGNEVFVVTSSIFDDVLVSLANCNLDETTACHGRHKWLSLATLLLCSRWQNYSPHSPMYVSIRLRARSIYLGPAYFDLFLLT